MDVGWIQLYSVVHIPCCDLRVTSTKVHLIGKCFPREHDEGDMSTAENS
jgi:hypothetical protein